MVFSDFLVNSLKNLESSNSVFFVFSFFRSSKVIFLSLIWVYRWGGFTMQDKVSLIVSKKGDKGFQVYSVPKLKLKELATKEHRHWRLEGDFLILTAY
jgi:hypothetical protein